MRGIVACEALYNLVERFAPQARVRFIPAELHEFPVNVPLHDEVTERIQAAIDDLEGIGCDPIVVSYSMNEATREVLDSTDAELVISDETDCISTVLPDERNKYDERKAPGTLYLTRGWIDCGVDGYKLFRAYRDDLDSLIERFDAAEDRHDDLLITWHRGDRFTSATDTQPVSDELLDGFFHEIVQHYDRVALVDTDDLYEIHHEYAALVQQFVSQIKQTQNHDSETSLIYIDGDLSRFDSLVAGE